jgi:4-amino-4-deoxy-L-arabinose transferase-like glycosyltransferase
MPEKNILKIGWIFTLAVFSAVLLPFLVQEGMFLDGVTYAAISKNLANGFGSLWIPQYTQTHFSQFHEHPPLVFGLQSLFFKLFGDGFLTERIFTLFTAILTAIGIVINWNLFNPTNKKYSWIPVLFWIATPLIFWSYQSNMLENTLAFCCLFSIYFIAKGSLKNNFFHLFLGSLFIFLALLTKGPVGLFPLAVVGVLWITLKPFSMLKGITYSIAVVVFSGIIFYIISKLQPGLIENLTSYFNIQVLPSLNNTRETTTGNHFTILGQLFLELIAPISLLLILFTIKKVKKHSIEITPKATALFFVLVGLSASLPLMVTLKQRGYYIVPSLPYFILAASVFIVPYLKYLFQNITDKQTKGLQLIGSVLLVAVFVFSFSQYGKFSRDSDKLSDIYKISSIVSDGSIISCSSELYIEWGTMAYLARVGGISITPNLENKYLIVLKNSVLPLGIEKVYTPLNLNLTTYQLYQKQ